MNRTFIINKRKIIAQSKIANSSNKINSQNSTYLTLDFKESEMKFVIAKVSDLGSSVIFKCESSREEFTKLLQTISELDCKVRHSTLSARTKARSLCIYPHFNQTSSSITHATKLGIKCTCIQINNN